MTTARDAAVPTTAVTDRHRMAGEAYGTGRHLAARQNLYAFQEPRHDLPGLVLAELVDVAGVVADVGCGNGTYVQRLRAERPDLTTLALDVSPGILAGIAGPVAVADAAALPLADGTAGAVLGMHMLYHVADIPAAVDEFARVLAPGGVVLVSTNSGHDKAALDALWSRAAGDVFGQPEGPRRVSLSARFTLEDAPGHMARRFGSVRMIELPGTITVHDPAPVVAHLASYRAWATETGVPFDATIDRARDLVADAIDRDGAFRIGCLGGILVCRP